MNKQKLYKFLDSIKYIKIVNDKKKLYHKKLRMRHGFYTFDCDDERRKFYFGLMKAIEKDKKIDESLNNIERVIVFALSGFKNISELGIDG